MLLQVPPQDNTQGGGKVSVKKPSEQRSLPSAPRINQCGLPPILQELCGGEGGGRAQGETEAQRGCRHLPKGKTLCTHMSAQTQETEMAGQRHL